MNNITHSVFSRISHTLFLCLCLILANTHDTETMFMCAFSNQWARWFHRECCVKWTISIHKRIRFCVMLFYEYHIVISLSRVWMKRLKLKCANASREIIIEFSIWLEEIPDTNPYFCPKKQRVFFPFIFRIFQKNWSSAQPGRASSSNVSQIWRVE